MTIIIQHMNNKPMNDDNNNDNEQHMMLPLEVEHYYETNEVDAKNTGFLDEYKENELPKENPRFKQTKYGLFSLVIFSAFLLFGIRRSSRSPVLRFRFGTEHHGNNFYYNRTFQIMQITDIHLGEAEYTDWGPLQDQKTMLLLDTIFAIEKPDLIVLGGDQLTANNCLQNCTEYYKILGRFLSNYNIPWATIMGNHDDMDFEVEDGTGTTIPHSVGLRKELLQTDQRFPLSLSQNSLNNVTGVTNYVLDVFDPVTDNISLQIFLLDSGGGSMREAIEDDQVQWLRKAATTDTRTAAVPAVAFQHIPTYAHQYVDDACFGYQGEGIAGLTYDGGIIDAMTEAGRFHFLAVGHNHGNDVCVCAYVRNVYSFVIDLFCSHAYIFISKYNIYPKFNRTVLLSKQ